MTTIRKATPSDILLIREMAWKTFPATYSEILSREQTDYMMEWMYSPESLRDQMERQGHVYYIACEDNEPAGYVSVQRQGPGLFHLQKIYGPAPSAETDRTPAPRATVVRTASHAPA